MKSLKDAVNRIELLLEVAIGKRPREAEDDDPAPKRPVS